MEELIQHLKPMQVFSEWCKNCKRYRYMEYSEDFDDEIVFDKDRLSCSVRHGTIKIAKGKCFKCKYQFRTGKRR